MESIAVEDETPYITALGSLFKLTEVYLSDDTSVDVHTCLPSMEASKTINEDAVDSISSEFKSFTEDMELAKLMSVMGLPMSFRTKRGVLREKRKQKMKDKLSASMECNPIQDDVQEPFGENVGESASSEVPCKSSESLSSMLTGKESELSDFDAAAGVDEVCHPPDGVKDSISSISSSANSTVDDPVTSDPGRDQDLSSEFLSREKDEIVLKEDIGILENVILDGMVGIVCDEKDPKGGQMEESICVKSAFAVDHDARSAFDHWKVYWDNFYSRNYFHNAITQECSWDPPAGMEDLVYVNISDTPTVPQNDTAYLGASLTCLKEFSTQAISSHQQSICDLSVDYKGDEGFLDNQIHDSVGDKLVNDALCNTSSVKRKQKSRRAKSKKNISIQNGDFPFTNEGFHRSLSKYWCQRYSLFTKYDEGIQMDEEGWFSVTPEPLAKHHANRCAGGTVVDLFTGVGGNAIQFAQRCGHVIAIDIDPMKIDYAQHNAAIYGVCDRIDFIRADSLILAPALKVDVVYMSPPWGGPDYAKVKKFDIKSMLKPHDGYYLFNVGKGIASKVVMFLPRNVDINQLAEIALSANPSWSLEVFCPISSNLVENFLCFQGSSRSYLSIHLHYFF
ncbi:unnamed protein product [Cuscuta campestris]|uniref:Trimethylguanosine synthase n=1 Tax=Cuscuta campestris TaxID=132261 RepID=A0A484LL67_9ASTE|nr:unnamed protein product [Cuscuta campestris]